MDSGLWCRLTTRSVKPCETSQRMLRRTSGSPSTAAAAFALASVSGWSRVPSPAASTSARIYPLPRGFAPLASCIVAIEHHVAAGEAELLAVLEEQPPIGIEDVVRRAPAEQASHVGDAVLAAFDLDEDADRRLVYRH